MSDVQIFYASLNSAASAVDTATTDLLTVNAEVTGEDTGVENPEYRVALRLEMHRRLNALHDAAMNRIESGSGLGAALHAIVTRYSDLDVELNGQES
ncbi:MAG: hypothetical protein ACQEW8_06045 [Actinomycetota bacterium]